jgi:hypothetical protein
MRGGLLILVPFYLGNAVLFGFHEGSYIGAHGVLAVLLLLVTLLNEDRNATLSEVASLPVSRRQIVVARYAWAATMMVYCYGLALLYDVALVHWIPRFAVDSGALVSSTRVLIYATVVTLQIAILLPLYYRWGLATAMGGLAVAALIGLTSLSAIVMALSGSAWRLGPRTAMLAVFGRTPPRWMTLPEFTVIWTLVLVAILVVSAWLAVRGLKAREL